MVAVPFPTTAAPGRRPGEGTGELVNVYAEKNVEEVQWRRVPGLSPAYEVSLIPPSLPWAPRGMMGNSNLLVHGWQNAIAVTDAGGTHQLTGSVAGTDPITFARNNRLPIPDIVAVCQAGAFLIHTDTLTVTAYSAVEPDVGSPNSVSYFGGYFMFTYGNGRIVASDIQNISIDANSYANAEANPDGLYRGVSIGSSWLAMGPLTIEVWQDSGQSILPSGSVSPFPLTRATVIPVGLIGPWAVAGSGDEWDRPLLFVASDYTVRMLDGYAPKIVSTVDVAADIYEQKHNPTGLVAYVHIHNDNAVWCVSCADWTWCYNLTTQSWHKRASYLQSRWRVGWTAQAFEKWLGQDTLSGQVLEITPDAEDEVGQPLISMARSGPVKDFPTNVRVNRAFFDFTVGLGSVLGASTVGVETSGTNPTVLISWSHDGGATWANPLRRSLGRQGEFKTLVQVNNLGRSSHHGLRVEWRIADPVPFKFRGAVLPTIKPRRPAQVWGASANTGVSG
jgi:hypothetical protein